MDKGIQAARLADQIRDYLALWSNQDMPGYLFSFTQVTLSPDLSRATAWLDVLMPEQTATVYRKLKDRMPQYQHRLGRELGKRNNPTVVIAIDRGSDDQTSLAELLKR